MEVAVQVVILLVVVVVPVVTYTMRHKIIQVRKQLLLVTVEMVVMIVPVSMVKIRRLRV